MRPKVTLHVVSSLDGFIASKDNSVSWMDSPGDAYDKGVTFDNADAIPLIDCYVLGSRTYEHALQLGWPYGDTPVVVVTIGNCRPQGRPWNSTPAISRD